MRYKKKTGIVVLLDALGIRGISITNAKEFFKSFKNLINLAKNESKKIVVLRERLIDKIGEPSITAFGDTILLTWKIREDSENLLPELFLLSVSELLKSLIIQSFKSKILLRGAISVGDFIESSSESESSSIVIGPAIADAASWYEEAQWFGVIATPKCGILLSKLYESPYSSKYQFPYYYIEYNGVPLKRENRDKLWSVSWPIWYLVRKPPPDNRNIAYEFLNDLSKFPNIPFEDKKKFDHTIKFFDYFNSENFKLQYTNHMLRTYQTINDINI